MNVLKEIIKAWKFYQEAKRKDECIIDLYTKLVSVGILEMDTPRATDWGLGEGTAGRYIAKYGLLIRGGVGFGDIRADLPQGQWQKALNPNVSSFDYGTFTLQNPNDVKTIYGYGLTLREAVYRCLLNAHTAGVI